MQILVIDDEPTNIEVLDGYLKQEGYDVFNAENGKLGLELLHKHPKVSAILLDKSMPVMGGIEFLNELKLHPKYYNLPVIMQTAASDEASIIEGITAGAYYYLIKPYNKQLLISILNAAINDSKYKFRIEEEVRKHRKMLGLLNEASFDLKTMEEAQNLAYFIAGGFPDPEKVVLGLSEMMLNAVEHGNLKISYHEKGQLMRSGNLANELQKREALPENQNKKVLVQFEKDDKIAKVTITDEGEGFNWNEFLQMNPKRASDPNGRGILMARTMSFDTIEYMGNGNKVCCSVKLSANKA